METATHSNLKHYRILPRIKTEIEYVAPDAEIIVYGSVARGEATEESDIDLLIVVPEDSLNAERRNSIYDCTTAIELDENINISIILRTRRQWMSPPLKTPFIVNVKNEGKRL